MAGRKGTEPPEAAVISRRDAIVGALALAAGTLVAARPEVALAANYEAVTIGDTRFGSLQTAIMRTSNGTISGTPFSTATFNGVAPISNADHAINGTVWYGANPGSVGVRGRATVAGHYGMLASHDLSTGTALRVEGRLSLSRSGSATVGKGHSGCIVTVPGGIEPGSLILATLQGSAGTGVYLRYAKWASPTTFSVKLNKAAIVAVSVAWIVVG